LERDGVRLHGVDDEKPVGTYGIEFTVGHSGEVRNLPSGISAKCRYTSGVNFYSLSTGNFLSTKKMIRLK
jgi:hypothetical protein